MNDIQIFNNPEFGEIRTVNINNEPWFVGKDIAQILGYAKPLNALAMHIDEDDSLKQGLTDGLGRKQETIFINESGLYSLVLSSKLPTAKKFKRWVTSEVLPTIRKHGAYMTAETLENALLSPDYLIKIATRLKEEQEARRKAEAVIEANRPKVIYADAVSVSDDVVSIGKLANFLNQNGVNTGRNRLIRWMQDNGYLIRYGRDHNTPTQKAMDLGLFKVKQTTITSANGSVKLTRTSLVTGKGQQYFVNKFLGKDKGEEVCNGEAF